MTDTLCLGDKMWTTGSPYLNDIWGPDNLFLLFYRLQTTIPLIWPSLFHGMHGWDADDASNL